MPENPARWVELSVTWKSRLTDYPIHRIPSSLNCTAEYILLDPKGVDLFYFSIFKVLKVR